jgi:hypothetical protein
MEEKEKKLEALLRQIEFPGEQFGKIEEYLKKADIPKTVIDRIFAAEERRHRIKVWTIVAIGAFILLIVLGANRYITEFLVFFQSAILLFVSVALMAVCLTGIIGIIMNIDKQKIEDGVKISGERIEEFFTKMFHPR